MVDERDEQYDGQEDGEYHFSDDQINYEIESDAPKAADSGAAVKSIADFKSVLLNKLSQHRRTLIGGAAFLILIVVVYKMVMPSSTAPATDFTESAATPAPVVAAQPPPRVTEVPSTQPAAAQQSVAPAGMVTVAQPGGTPVPGAGSPGVPPQAAQIPSDIQQTLTPMQQAQAMVSQGAIQPTDVPQQVVTSPPDQNVQPVMDAQTKNISDRLVTLEQQNAAMINLLQTEYAQKMSDYETQNTAARGKMQELTKRLNRMESTLNQITQILQGGARQQSNSGMANVYPAEPAKMAEPKMVYSVQAIIPGRAWLKSESGDTITVAEGDILRNYGRVTKIDPYDGVVNIDAGNKVITLSYGMNAE